MMKAIKSEGLTFKAHLTGATANVDIVFSWRIAEKADHASKASLKAILSAFHL